MADAPFALILCDVWDAHWCRSAVARLEAMIPQMAAVTDACRERGALVIHAPSDTMAFYDGTPARERARAASAPLPDGMVERFQAIRAAEPPLPIDDTDGGCDDEPACPVHWAWTRQHPGIRIDDAVDAVSDDGEEIWGLLSSRGVRRVAIMGVHANMCVLARPFGLRALAAMGMETFFVGDLTDAMYNPRRAPFVPHDAGTRLVVEHIARHRARVVSGADLPSLVGAADR